MALFTQHNEISFGVGDRVQVYQKIKEKDRTRTQIFEGMVIAIKNRHETRTFTVRRIGEAQVGIERIFPLASPLIEKVEVVKRGTAGVRHSKLYFTRNKPPREVEEIYSRTKTKEAEKPKPKPKKKKAKSSKRK